MRNPLRSSYWIFCLSLAGFGVGSHLPSGESISLIHQETLENLSEAIELGWPVRLIRSETSGNWGWSDWDEEAQTYVMAIHHGARPEIVVHEFAHLMVWDACLEDSHGPIWGVAYARAYRATFSD